MKNHPDYVALLQTLKKVLKAKGMTYSRLAREIGVSEVTVKRILSGQSTSMEHIFSICQRIDISFLDLAALAKKEDEVDHVLTPRQETYFAEKPAHFAIFKELHRGLTGNEVMRNWGLDSRKFYLIIRALEKLGLLEVLPGNQFALKTRGNIRMSHRGPLARNILRPQINNFLDHIDHVLENDDVCMHSAEVELATEHIPELVEEIHALGAKYRARAFRDKSFFPSQKLSPVRWLFAFAPYQTNWRNFKP